MRLTTAISIAAASAPLFTGCFTADDSRKPLAAHDKKCVQMGFQRGRTRQLSSGARAGGYTTRGRTSHDRLSD